MFFVLSSGRSGSETSARVFDQYEECVCLHHPEPDLVEEATQFFYGDLPSAEVEKILLESRKPLIDGKQYGEVNLQHTLLFPVIRKVFPEAKFVWLIRDGRRVVTSMFYRGWYDDKHFLYQNTGTMLGSWLTVQKT